MARQYFQFSRKQFAILIVGLIISGLSLSGCSSIRDAQNKIRQPAVAGSFYPEKAKELNTILKKAFRNAPPPKLNGDIKGLVLPHAAYPFSGIIAAMGMKTLVNKPIDTIYIIGTAHHVDVGGAITWQGKAFRTPLGLYHIDMKAVRELLETCPDIHLLPRAWVREHSVEVQIPFLQSVAPKAKLVPLIMGTATWDECWSVAQAISKQAADRNAIVIVSADMSHYPTKADAEVVDKKILATVEAMDPYKLDALDREIMSKGIPNLVCTMCGISAVKTGLLTANLMGANEGQKIHYANSGMIVDEKNKVVGYGAVAFVQNDKVKKLVIQKQEPKESFTINAKEKKELLSIARAAITEGIATGVQMQPTTAQKILLEKYPVFVTLKKDDQLRGCIGMTEARLPVYQAVAQMACAAAFEDPRYNPVTSDELAFLDIEVSVLSPFKRIQNTSEIVLGIHGVFVKRGDRQGLFLPQVATENKWNKETFLDNLCRQKAQLPADAWRDKNTELYIFKVATFEEKAPGIKQKSDR